MWWISTFTVESHISHVSARSRLSKLVAASPVPLRLLVYENCLPLPFQGYATEVRHFRAFAVVLLLDDLETDARPVLGFRDALILVLHLPCGGLVLCRKGPYQRHLHDPFQFPEMGDVVGQKVVVNDASELRLVLCHDGEIFIVE